MSFVIHPGSWQRFKRERGSQPPNSVFYLFGKILLELGVSVFSNTKDEKSEDLTVEEKWVHVYLPIRAHVKSEIPFLYIAIAG